MLCTRDEILALIPHQGSMCLLDEVLSWSERGVRCRTNSHQRHDNPLRCGQRLRAVHLCEYGAQAMALHGGLLAQAAGTRPRPGLLVSLRAVHIECAWLETLSKPLEVTADVLLATPESWQYVLRIEHAGTLLAHGRAAVILRGDATPRVAAAQSQ